MAFNIYDRLIVWSTEIICWLLVAVAACLWLATITDHLLGLGWGLDFQLIWIAPIIIGGALPTRTLSRAIFRSAGVLG